jgi:hypothetical protein
MMMSLTQKYLWVAVATFFGVLSMGAVASACPQMPQVKIKLACEADLTGLAGAAPSVSSQSAVLPLTTASMGQAASLSFGDYSVSAKLVCSGKGTLKWTLETRFTSSQHSWSNPLHISMLTNLELDKRSSPLELHSYHFFERPFTYTYGRDKKSLKVTRVDYTCRVIPQ